MRATFLYSTSAFWIVIATLAAAGAIMSGPSPAVSEDRRISPDELAIHARPNDCWIAIRGSVYDLTKYLPDHPSRPEVIEAWCGKEATQAYETKTKGRKHSEAADNMLPAYRIGAF